MLCCVLSEVYQVTPDKHGRHDKPTQLSRENQCCKFSECLSKHWTPILRQTLHTLPTI